jgi:hypothetical protein
MNIIVSQKIPDIIVIIYRLFTDITEYQLKGRFSNPTKCSEPQA